MNLNCSLGIIPMRSQPADQSEMISQLLYGEEFSILEENTKWVRIISLQDQYEGWICRKQAFSVSAIPFGELPIQKPIFHEGVFYPAASYIDISGIYQEVPNLEDTAKSFLKTPYLWGGKTHAGIDCSGLTQVVFRMQGLTLPRDANQQVNLGDEISFIEETKTGDLAFFDNEEGKIIHVGIVIREESNQYPSIIHASGWVRMDTLDNEGIKKENGEQSHRLRVIKRFQM